MIAVTFALRAESAHLVAQLRRNKISQRQIAIWHTGVGQTQCSLRIEQLLKSEQPDFLISSGFAGGVREDLQVGDLILAKNFSDRELLAKAEQILSDCKVRAVRTFTSTTIVNSIAERNEIVRANNAAAVDMETAVIAGACSSHGVPMLSLRVITDSLEDPLPLPPAVLFDVEQQRTDFAKLAAHLLQHPGAAWRLIHFSREIARARANLASTMIKLLREL